MGQSTIILTLDGELEQAFAERVRRGARTPAAVLEDLVRDYVFCPETEEIEPGYEGWFAAKIEQSFGDVRDGRVHRTAEVVAEFAEKRMTRRSI